MDDNWTLSAQDTQRKTLLDIFHGSHTYIHTYEKEAKKEKTFIHYRQRIGFSKDLRKKLNFLKSQRNNKKKIKEGNGCCFNI